VIFAILVPAVLALGWPLWPRRFDARTAALRVLPFVALVIAWRLPPVLVALARTPALSVAEVVTVGGAGWVLWSGLWAARRLHQRPLAAAAAAVAMWTVWVIAYITGMSGSALLPAGIRAASISAAADREIAAAVLWAVPAICFAPFIYATVIGWLGERADSDRDLASAASADAAFPDKIGTSPRPPRGWRPPASGDDRGT
jgi:hypothetical protein